MFLFKNFSMKAFFSKLTYIKLWVLEHVSFVIAANLIYTSILLKACIIFHKHVHKHKTQIIWKIRAIISNFFNDKTYWKKNNTKPKKKKSCIYIVWRFCSIWVCLLSISGDFVDNLKCQGRDLSSGMKRYSIKDGKSEGLWINLGGLWSDLWMNLEGLRMI